MDTEKLYDQDAFLREFDAVVTECYEGKDGSCLVTLDRTAFYPEGGVSRRTMAYWAARRCWTFRSGRDGCFTPATAPCR